MGNHIREERTQKFCYDFALMMRRITGKTPEGQLISQGKSNELELCPSDPDVTNGTDVTKRQNEQEQ